jgi:hypothetical protein
MLTRLCTDYIWLCIGCQEQLNTPISQNPYNSANFKDFKVLIFANIIIFKVEMAYKSEVYCSNVEMHDLIPVCHFDDQHIYHFH